MTISQQALNQVRSIIRELDNRIASARQQRKQDDDTADTPRVGARETSGDAMQPDRSQASIQRNAL
jgi:hypothetical protein